MHIKDFRVTWVAEHGQYWQGHSVTGTKFNATATGCGSTLREAFEDAVGSLQDYIPTLTVHEDTIFVPVISAKLEQYMLDSLEGDDKTNLIDMGIVAGYCDVQGRHITECGDCGGTGEVELDGGRIGTCDMCENGEVADDDPDCAVCAGEWHYYVSIDLQVEHAATTAQE